MDKINKSNDLELIKSIYKNELVWYEHLHAKVFHKPNEEFTIILNEEIKTSDFNLADFWFTSQDQWLNIDDEINEVEKIFRVADIKSFAVRIPQKFTLENVELFIKMKNFDSGGEDIHLVLEEAVSLDEIKVDPSYKMVQVSNSEERQLWESIDGCGVKLVPDKTAKYLFYSHQEPIGCLETLETDLLGYQICGIYSVKISPNHRGRGFGELMLRKLMTSQKKNFYIQTWDTNPALNLYKKLGFREVYRFKRYLKEDKI